jgi:phage terminase large subunit-like protein
MLRAQPVASLYEMGRVHHVGQYPELEAEMTTYTGDDGQASPNRLDAAVYAVAALAFEQAPDINISFV